MDALSLIVRPLPQTPPSPTGAAPPAKPSASSGKPEEAPAFAPAEQAPQAAADTPTEKKEAAPAAATEESAAPETTGPQDQTAVVEPAETVSANASPLLIAQAAATATPTTPVA